VIDGLIDFLIDCRALREAETKAPGFQRLRMAQYDELRKKLVSSHGGKLVKGEVRAALVWLHAHGMRHT
jgi:hypothetical protein